MSRRHRRALLLMVLAAAATAMTGCDRPSFGTRLNERQVQEIGAEAAAQLQSQYASAGPNDPRVGAFGDICRSLAARSSRLPSGVQLRFAVIEADEELALSLPDGHIYLSSGLLQKVGKDPSETACVVAHEIGHVALMHDVTNLTAALGDATVADMLGQGKYQDVVNLQLQLGRLSYTKDQEYEADRYAVHLAAASGYDASALARFLALESGEQRVESQVYWSDTHPLSSVRVARILQAIRAMNR